MSSNQIGDIWIGEKIYSLFWSKFTEPIEFQTKNSEVEVCELDAEHSWPAEEDPSKFKYFQEYWGVLARGRG